MIPKTFLSIKHFAVSGARVLLSMPTARFTYAAVMSHCKYTRGLMLIQISVRFHLSNEHRNEGVIIPVENL